MTITVPIRRPRMISPDLIEIGDDISVEIIKPDRGITTTKRGIVGKRIYSGKSRYYSTIEGATLFSYEPGRVHGLKITLYGRAEQVQETLFEIDNSQLRERIA